jgi:glycosyltransferase involved in cell wall biosynthesis
LLALHAALLLPSNYELVFVGDGPIRRELEDAVEELGLVDRVTFTGALSNPCGWIVESDVVIVPSRYEGFGLVAAEARALGAKLVATAVPGLREIAPLMGGTLVPEGDASALAAAIVEVVNSEGLPGTEWLASLNPAAVGHRYYEVLVPAVAGR